MLHGNREDFPAKATLADVLAYIDKHRTDGSRPYLLRTSFPRRSLTAALGLATLESLDLCPRSLLVLQPAGGLTSSPVSAAPGKQSPSSPCHACLRRMWDNE